MLNVDYTTVIRTGNKYRVLQLSDKDFTRFFFFCKRCSFIYANIYSFRLFYFFENFMLALLQSCNRKGVEQNRKQKCDERRKGYSQGNKIRFHYYEILIQVKIKVLFNFESDLKEKIRQNHQVQVPQIESMNWEPAVSITLNTLVVVIHVLALTLLFVLKLDSHLKKFLFIYFNESPLKMMKSAFYFLLNALFVLKIFKFLS